MNDRGFIPYGRQWLDDEDIAAVVDVLRGEMLTQGPVVKRFEKALAEYCGAKHAVAVSNGTVALHLACMAAGLGPDHEGITSPISFLASASCMIYCGARPVFADIDSQTWNIDPAEIRKKITRKTKVIIPVHLAGLSCDIDAIKSLAQKHDITVIEDACHAIGAGYKGKKIGWTSASHMVCFSFHPVKHITTGEGGAVLTDSDELVSRLRRLRHHGITNEKGEMTRCDGPWYYEAKELGINGRISDFQCGLGLSQLPKLDRFVMRRREIAERYRRFLGSIQGLSFQIEPPQCEHSYHLFVIHFDPERYDRLRVFKALRKANIGAQIHYIPLNRQPAINTRAGVQGPLKNADYYYSGCISLPMYPALTRSDQDRVISVLKESLGQ